ncbi:MAG: glycosyltransferase [Nibricoccus sp.]
MVKISVVIPVRNVSDAIQNILDQVIAQDFNREEFEVNIADGASSDNTVDVINGYRNKGVTVNVIRIAETGRSAGLNAAIKASRGEYICRLDLRTQIGPNYLKECLATIERTGAANIGGLQVPVGRTEVQRAIGWAMSHPFGAGNAKFKTAKASGYVDSVYLGFFRKSVFNEIGLFDDSGRLLSEDSDMNERIRASGQKIYLNVEIKVGYEPRGSLWQHFKLYHRYGIARIGNLRKNRRLTSWRQLPAPVFVAGLVLCPLICLFLPVFWWGFGIAVGFYLMLLGYVSALLAWRNKSPIAFLTLLGAFPLMHIGWGSGFWRGLFAMSNRDEKVVV